MTREGHGAWEAAGTPARGSVGPQVRGPACCGHCLWEWGRLWPSPRPRGHGPYKDVAPSAAAASGSERPECLSRGRGWGGGPGQPRRSGASWNGPAREGWAGQGPARAPGSQGGLWGRKAWLHPGLYVPADGCPCRETGAESGAEPAPRPHSRKCRDLSHSCTPLSHTRLPAVLEGVPKRHLSQIRTPHPPTWGPQSLGPQRQDLGRRAQAAQTHLGQPARPPGPAAPRTCSPGTPSTRQMAAEAQAVTGACSPQP